MIPVLPDKSRRWLTEATLSWLFSTSGNSKGILDAVKVARDKGAITIGFTGKDGGLLGSAADICLKIPSTNTPRIQECHITVGHIVCSIVEKELFGAVNK